MLHSEDFLQGKNVLIVDDDVRNIFALSSYLEGMGMHVLTAENGYKAINFLRHHPEIDIVLMDMMMPEMDGYEAIAAIQSDNSIVAVPIIAVTAKAMKGDREKCLEAGASEYVSKPVNLKELLDKMVQLTDVT
jgi:two-component system, chemotaxis family, sensor kinase CheA